MPPLVRAGLVRDNGFTLIEVLVAMTLLATASAGVGGLITMAGSSVRAARAHTWATILAGDKLEHMRALSWSQLGRSPGGALQRDVAGYVDYLDAKGQEVGSAAGAVYTRRWSIQALPADPDNTVLLQVLVMPTVRHGGISVALTSLRSRKDL
jgi:prepilin-type N-terminal cleavage/methylation domain-containing protein